MGDSICFFISMETAPMGRFWAAAVPLISINGTNQIMDDSDRRFIASDRFRRRRLATGRRRHWPNLKKKKKKTR